MQPSLLGLQGFNALGAGVELTLIQVGQALTRFVGWGRWTPRRRWRRAWLTRLAPIAVDADVLTHAAIAFEGIQGGHDAIEKGAVVRDQEQRPVVFSQETL